MKKLLFGALALSVLGTTCSSRKLKETITIVRAQQFLETLKKTCLVLADLEKQRDQFEQEFDTHTGLITTLVTQELSFYTRMIEHLATGQKALADLKALELSFIKQDEIVLEEAVRTFATKVMARLAAVQRFNNGLNGIIEERENSITKVSLVHDIVEAFHASLAELKESIELLAAHINPALGLDPNIVNFVVLAQPFSQLGDFLDAKLVDYEKTLKPLLIQHFNTKQLIKFRMITTEIYRALQDARTSSLDSLSSSQLRAIVKKLEIMLHTDHDLQELFTLFKKK